MTDDEDVEMRDASASGHDVVATRPTDDDDRMRIALIDAIPCNLRHESWFLKSRIEATLSRRNLRLFLRCYGFLMYDKAEKLAILRASRQPAVREVAEVLDECRTLADFKVSVQQHLEHIKSLLSDPNAIHAMVDVDDDNGGGGGDTLTKQREQQRQSSLHILDLARRSFEYVVTFIRDSDHLRRNLNVNEYCRCSLIRQDERALRSVYDAWHDAANCDLDRCLSIVFRDVVVTTGVQTQSTLLFVLRASLVLTYLVTNFMCSRNDDDAVRIEVRAPDVPDSESDALAEYWSSCCNMTVEKFVATTMVAMTRMYVAACVDWPNRIRESAPNVSLTKIRAKLIGRLLRVPRQQRDSKALPWLRVMRVDRTRNRATPDENDKRLYVRFEALLQLFEQLSTCVHPAKSLSTTEDEAEAAARDGDFATVDLDQPLTVRIDNRHVNRQWQEYQYESRACVDAIVESLNECAVEATLRNGDDGGSCGGRVNAGTTTTTSLAASPAAVSIEQFVTALSTTYRDHDDDLATVVRSEAGNGGSAASSSSYDDAQGDRDEVELLSADVGKALLFAVLSLVRHTPDEKRYGGDAWFNDDANESHQVLLVHAMSHLYRARMTLNQVRELFSYLMKMWWSQVGIVSLEHLSEILFTLYRMFHGATANATPPSEPPTNSNDDQAEKR